MRKVVLMILTLVSVDSWAEYTPWAVPTQVSLVTNQGFRVYGDFGTPNGCELEDQIFVSVNHPQYKEIYSMVLAAVASQKETRFEVRACSNIGWISSKSIGALTSSSSEATFKY